MAIIQVWSAPSCEAGAICFGALAPWVSASGSEATGTPAGFRVMVTRDVADAASLAEGRCLRVLSLSRGEQWWFVSSVADSDGDAGLVQVTAGPLRQLLTVRGLVRDADTFAFDTGKQTVAALLTARVLTNLVEDGLSWITLGTIDFPDTVEIGALDRVTRAAVLDAIEGQTGHTARLRPLFTAGVLSGFALDVVSDVAAGLDTVPLSAGSDIDTLQRTRDALRAATVALPFSADGRPMDQTVWVVDSISGTAPAWIVLRDPLAGNPWPIREDDQVVGAYLQQRAGTQSQILDSRASDSAVQIASVGSLVAGAEVTIVRNTASAPVIELTSPKGIASSRGRLVGTVSTRVTDGRRNLVPNPVFRSWTNDTAPTGYTIGYFGGGGTGIVARYPRSTTPGTADMILAVDGAVASGASSIPVRGGVAGQRLYRREYFTVAGVGAFRINANVITLDGTGRATVPIYGTTSSGISDGASVTVFIATPGAGPLRPSALPDDTTTDVLRLLGERTTLTSPATPVRSSGTQRVSVAAGISVRSNTVEDALGGAWWPSLLLLDTGTGLTLASAPKPAIPLASTVHYPLTASAVIASDTTVSAQIIAGVDDLLGGFGTEFMQWQGVRWLSLWLGDGPVMSAQEGSGSNKIWHRAQDVLASAASGTRYTARGVDLTRLQHEHGTLALGQTVRLRSPLLGVDGDVRIVKLDYDFTGPEVLNLELGAITPRLTGVTVNL